MGIFIRVSLYTSVCADLHIQRDCVCVYACVDVYTWYVRAFVCAFVHARGCVCACVEVGACVRVCV